MTAGVITTNQSDPGCWRWWIEYCERYWLHHCDGINCKVQRYKWIARRIVSWMHWCQISATLMPTFYLKGCCHQNPHRHSFSTILAHREIPWGIIINTKNDFSAVYPMQKCVASSTPRTRVVFWTVSACTPEWTYNQLTISVLKDVANTAKIKNKSNKPSQWTLGSDCTKKDNMSIYVLRKGFILPQTLSQIIFSLLLYPTESCSEWSLTLKSHWRIVAGNTPISFTTSTLIHQNILHNTKLNYVI